MKIEIIQNDTTRTPAEYLETLDYIWIRKPSELGFPDDLESYVVNGCRDDNGKIAIGILGHRQDIDSPEINTHRLSNTVKSHCGFKITYLTFDQRLNQTNEVENVWWEDYMDLISNHRNGVMTYDNGDIIKDEHYTVQYIKKYDYIWFEDNEDILDFMKKGFQKTTINNQTIYFQWINQKDFIPTHKT